MIIGIGHDIVDIARIKADLDRHGDRFTQRCFTEEEIALAQSRRDTGLEAATYAKRFAAKEAVVKALGTGVRDGITLKDIGVSTNGHGAPSVRLSGKIAGMIADKNARIHLSLSDEAGLASAYVIIEACEILENS